jgi:hypothetical protein
MDSKIKSKCYNLDDYYKNIIIKLNSAMNLDQQIEILVKNAPQDGVTPTVIAEAIAPVLKIFAQQLKHLEYYILQTFQKNWVVTTLQNKATPNMEKKVIYAFTTLQDAKAFQGTADPNIIATSMPVTHIIFQLFAMKQVDSLVLMEQAGNLTMGAEVHQQDLQQAIQSQLQKFTQAQAQKSTNIPPNFA